MNIIISISLYLAIFVVYSLYWSIVGLRKGLWFAFLLPASLFYLASIDLGWFGFAGILGFITKCVLAGVPLFFYKYLNKKTLYTFIWAILISISFSILLLLTRTDFVNYHTSHLLFGLFAYPNPFATWSIPNNIIMNFIIIFITFYGLVLSVYSILLSCINQQVKVKTQVFLLVPAVAVSSIILLLLS